MFSLLLKDLISDFISFAAGNVQVSGIFYGNAKVFLHDKNDQWLGVAVDVAPSNNKVAVRVQCFALTKVLLHEVGPTIVTAILER